MADASHRMAKPAPQSVAQYLPPISHTGSLSSAPNQVYCTAVGFTTTGGVGSKSTLTAFQRGSDKVGPEWRQSARRRPKRPGAAPATRCAPPLRRQKLPVPCAAPKTGRQTAEAAAHGRPNGARAAAAAR